MNMSKLLAGSTLLIVVATVIGSLYWPNAMIMNFAATSALYDVIRVILIGLLVALLVTRPPRSVALRTLLGGWSIILAVISTALVLSFQINFIDIVVFMELSIIFALEALETSVAPASRQEGSNPVVAR